MLTTSDIVWGAVLPFILCGAVLWLTRLTGLTRAGAPLAIGIAFTAAFGAIEGTEQIFPPSSAVPWLFYLGPLFTLVGLLDASVRLPMWLRPIVIFLATLLGAGLVLRFNFVNHTWDALHGARWLVAISIVAVIWWACFEYTSTEVGLAMPLGAMLVTGIAGLVVMLVAIQIIGQALGALAIAFISAALLMAWFKNISLARGTAAVVSGLGVCALAAAYFLSEIPIIDVLLVASAPLLLAGSSWLPLGKLRPWLRVSIRLAIVLIPLGAALGLAVAQFQQEAAEKSADPYSFVVRTPACRYI